MVSALSVAVFLPSLVAPASIAQDEKRQQEKADDRSGRDLFDPDQFIDWFFGETSEADEETLAKVTIGEKEERQFGKNAAEAFLADLRRQRIRVTDRGKDVAYLRELVGTLQPFMRNKDRYGTFAIYCADSAEPDARSFPGGTLIFSRGLLDLVGSEAALVGVIGHELSHLDHGHQLRLLRTMKLAQQPGGASQAFSLSN